jgi:nitroreductase
MAVCPTNSIVFQNNNTDSIENLKSFDVTNFDNFLSSIRSVRHFKNTLIDNLTINNLIKIAKQAPAASNWRTSDILIISDSSKISSMEKITIAHFKKLLSLFNPFIINILGIFRSSLKNYLLKNKPSILQLIDKYEQGHNPVFHNAPHVAVFYGPSVNKLSKDNCDAMMHYFRIYAHSLGIGSCIIGYAYNARKDLKKFLDLPKEYDVFGFIIFGYPLLSFRKAIIRQNYLK